MRSPSWRVFVSLGIALAIGSTIRAQPQEVSKLDPAITDVVTGGNWSAGDREGSFRLVVVTHGYEHLISRLYVQWLEAVPDSGETRLLSTALVDAIPDGFWTLNRPRLVRVGGEWLVLVEGTDTHTDPPRRARWRLAVGAPGELRVRSAAP